MLDHVRKLITVVCLTLATVALVGCGARYMDSPIIAPDSDIERTEEREAILLVIQDYSDALTALDLDRIGELISNDYYENNGTTHTTDDDYGYQGIMNLFDTLKNHVQDVRVRLAVREINVQDDRADVLFDYDYTMLYSVGESERWSTERDVNRIELRNEAGNWRIISGL